MSAPLQEVDYQYFRRGTDADAGAVVGAAGACGIAAMGRAAGATGAAGSPDRPIATVRFGFEDFDRVETDIVTNLKNSTMPEASFA